MQFSNVINLDSQPPEGWPSILDLEQYAKLDEERKRYYGPLYKKYRTKRVRDYDPDYGNFVGWKPIQVGIGEPVGYRYVGYIASKVIDQVNNSNVLMARVLKSSGERVFTTEVETQKPS